MYIVEKDEVLRLLLQLWRLYLLGQGVSELCLEKYEENLGLQFYENLGHFSKIEILWFFKRSCESDILRLCVKTP